MLKKFKEDRARWYRQYVENIWDEPKNSSQFLGTAFHETAESFAKDLMAQQSDPNKRVSTPEELKKTFYKKLIEPDKQTHQVFFKEDNGKIKELTGKKTIDKKVELAAKTLELLPEILKDYEILGVEQSIGFHDTAPEKINSIDGSKVNTTGKVDLILRNRKTGMVNWLDWKPYDMDPNNKDPKHDALNQLLLYAGSDRAGGKIPAPDSLQALNYLNPDGLKTSLQNQFVASADIVKERIDEFKYKIKENASDLDIAVLMSALANADSSGTLLAHNHRSKQNISSNAMIAFSALKGKNPDEIITAWGNLGNTNSLATKMLQEDFSTILGEETTSKLLNGQLNDIGMSYAERMISAYGNEGAGYTDYEYAGLAEQVLGGLDANLTPEAKLSYINSLPTEMIDALKEKISGFEDYVNLATMSAEGKANSGVTDAKVADARKAFELGISDAKIRDLEKKSLKDMMVAIIMV